MLSLAPWCVLVSCYLGVYLHERMNTKKKWEKTRVRETLSNDWEMRRTAEKTNCTIHNNGSSLRPWQIVKWEHINSTTSERNEWHKEMINMRVGRWAMRDEPGGQSYIVKWCLRNVWRERTETCIYTVWNGKAWRWWWCQGTGLAFALGVFIFRSISPSVFLCPSLKN